MTTSRLFKKVTLYQLADGRTVNTLEEARSEGLKTDTLKQLTSLIESKGVSMTSDQKSIMRASINAMIDLGWRPPPKQYAKKKSTT